MRVVTGSAKGVRLVAPPGDSVRPTSDRAKEGIFSALSYEVEGARVLDLFCGSGQLGIEALSRGADWAVFVDASSQSCEVTKRNLEASKLTAKARVFTQDAMNYVRRCKEQFDIVFMDPPYRDLELGCRLLEELVNITGPGGVILYETARGDSVPKSVGHFTLTRHYHYGKTSVAAYRIGEATP